MPLFNFKKRHTAPMGIWLTTPGVICPSGYIRLVDSPEIGACIDRITSLIAGLPIYLLRNDSMGDVRDKGRLARFVDVTPWTQGSRYAWMSWVVATLLGDGDGNAFCFIRTELGELRDLIPMPGAVAQQNPDGLTYHISWRGQTFAPEDVLHFRLFTDPEHPWRGRGYRVKAQDVADSLHQAGETKTAYMRSDYKPPLIVSVDADSDLADEEKKKALEQAYMKREPGQPWIVPGEFIKVDTVRPLSLKDLSIAETMSLDRRTAAAIYGLPPFMVGEGAYNKEEFMTFVRVVIKTICDSIQQELTRKLLWADDRYFKFSVRRLYNYDAAAMASLMLSLAERGFASGNEVRAELDLDPRKGLDKLTALENYIPVDKAGDQKKLVQDVSKLDTNDGEEEEEEDV